MNLQLKVVFIVLLAIPYAAFGLKCYKCTSTKSWEDCDDKKSSEVTCTGNDVTCYKAHYSTADKTIQQFAKSCGPTTHCTKTSNPVCKVHLGASGCDIDCCEEDMCNAASLAGVGGLVVLSGVLVAALCSQRHKETSLNLLSINANIKNLDLCETNYGATITFNDSESKNNVVQVVLGKTNRVVKNRKLNKLLIGIFIYLPLNEITS